MATIEGEPVPSTFEEIARKLRGDDVYTVLKKVFLAKGRGRRPDLPTLSALDNSLLLQVYLLKEEGDKTFDDAAAFLLNLFPDLTESRLRCLMSETKLNWEKQNTIQLQEDFLKKRHDTTGVGPHLQQLEISRQQLLTGDCHLASLQSPTKGLLLDLESFRKREGSTFEMMCRWWFRLTQQTVTAAAMRRRVVKVGDLKNRLIGLKKGNVDSFLAETLDSSILPASSPAEPGNTTTTLDSEKKSMTLTIQQLGRELNSVRHHVKEVEQENQTLNIKFQAAMETAQKSSAETRTLQQVITQRTHQLRLVEGRLETLQINHDSISTRLKQYTKGTLSRKLKHTTNKVMKLQERVDDATTLVATHKQQRDGYKKKLRDLQVQHADLKRRYRRTRIMLENARQPTAPDAQINQELAADVPIIRLKDERGHFTKDAIVCIMQLVGECEVPPARCGDIIRAVIQHTVKGDIPAEDLPSVRSAIRFADRGHVIAKAHVASTISQAEAWDLHVDGTSRGGSKYIGHQVTVAGQTLSLGFSPVSVENTTTLVDVTINLLEELSDIYPEADAHTTFIEMLQRVSGMMCDRASVMKSAGRALNTLRQDLLQTPDDIQFLHCNAHFLLGMSTESEKALSQMEKAGGQRLGRDRLPQFRSFLNSTESSGSRYVRLACDCLGPRGDDKNGCKEWWDTHCLTTQQPSFITSFRSNRFNNLFEAASALHFHREDIYICIKDLPKMNRKIQSVLEDNRSEEIDCQIIALGLLYYWLTGPYWSLLGKELHYLDFHAYIEHLHQFLTRWAADPSDAFTDQPEPLFGFVFMPNNTIYSSLLAVTEDKKISVKAILKRISEGCLAVTERQLTDFLPGGKYHQIEDPVLRERMAHSRLTNLIGEQCFGDLDFSLFKRRNASLFYHSSINLLKRNKSISQFLMTESKVVQDQLLELSAKKAPASRKKHVQEAKEAVARRELILQEHRDKRTEAEQKRQQKIRDTMAKLAPHQGPCVHHDDVNRLLSVHTTAASRLQAVKAEILYQKIVLKHSSPLLKVTGTLPQLVQNLKLFLGADEQNAAANIPPPARQPRKRQRCVAFSDSELSATSDSVSESDVASDSGSREDEAIPAFSFDRPGEMVAVFYWDDFFVGEVTRIDSAEEAEVNFLERSKGAGVLLRWPMREDRCVIKSCRGSCTCAIFLLKTCFHDQFSCKHWRPLPTF